MQSTYLSRSLFGCTRISLISVAVLVGTMVLPAKGTAQQTGNSQQSASTPESAGMAEHAGMPTSLRELIQEAEQKNPQIAASFHAWQASRNVPKQVSALPETQLSVQQFSVGSPRPFAGYSNSDFAYIGFGASQDIPYPGKRQLRARVAEHEADSMEAQTDSMRRTVVGNLKMVYFRLAYIQQTLGVLQRSDELLNQVQEAAEARYRVGQGNQQDVLKAQLQHTKILQEIAHHHQEEGLLEAQIKQAPGPSAGVRGHRCRDPHLASSSVFRSRTLAESSRAKSGCALKAGLHPAAGNPGGIGAQEFPSRLQRSVHLRAHRKPDPAITTWLRSVSGCPIAGARRPNWRKRRRTRSGHGKSWTLNRSACFRKCSSSMCGPRLRKSG